MKKINLLLSVLFFYSHLLSQSASSRLDVDSLFSTVITNNHGKCGFITASQIKLNYDRFSPSQKSVLNKILSRPELEKSIVSPSGLFRIHFDTYGENTPAYDKSLDVLENVQQVALIFDSVYSFEVGYLQYPPPPPDNNEGGDELYDVYILNLEAGNYGGTYPDDYLSSNSASSFIQMDNDFKGDLFFTHGIDALKVTAAHEFHHAIQLGNYCYDTNKDIFFYEMSATTLEEIMFDEVNDYYNNLREYFNNPELPFYKHNENNSYGLVIWNLFLIEKFDNLNIIKRQWEFFKTNSAIMAIELSLNELNTSFKNELQDFGMWTYFTGYRKELAVSQNLSSYFEEGENYPLIGYDLSTQYSNSLFPLAIKSKPLTNYFIRILNDNGVYTDTIVSIITNGNLSDALETPDVLNEFQYSLYDYQVEGAKLIANNYYSKLTGSGSYFLESDIFNNHIVEDGSYVIEIADFAYPSPFNYNKFSKLYFPVEYSRTGEAHFYIYSIGMNLIHDAMAKITSPDNKFVLEWDGKDSNKNKLSSGVYLYIIESENKLKKGKIVIYNE